MVIAPGLGSRKENHADMGAALAARGLAALALDIRGHGATGGALDGGAADDVRAGLAALRALGHARLGLRGSSMGALLALHVAAADTGAVGAVVAICAARREGLAARVGADWPLALEPAPPGPDGVARMLWHAAGDDRVPWGTTFALAGRTPHPMRMRIAMGGDHGSLQHDPAVLAATADFLAERLA